MPKSKKQLKVVLNISIDQLETLQGLLDGCLGTSDSDDFNDEIKPILKQLDAIQTLYYKNHP